MSPYLIKLAFALIIAMSILRLNDLHWWTGRTMLDRICSALLCFSWWLIGTLTGTIAILADRFTKEEQWLSVSAMILCLLYATVQKFGEKLMLISISVSQMPSTGPHKGERRHT